MAGIRTENKIYEVGIYCRLSKDDGTDNESASIATQKSILTDYVKRQGWHLAKTYVDDGYSGTNFQRPSFQNMIKDIENGLINCVITKDLSRLGRNYLDCGLYLEVFFPEHNVRYIAVNDGVDTLNKSAMDITPFRNILNEMYSADVSVKIKSAYRARFQQGKFMGTTAPYGYVKDPADHNHLLIDDKVAHVVREIFDLALAGNGIAKIRKHINKQHILRPAAYAVEQGATGYERYFEDNEENRYIWSENSVRGILRSPIYAGNLAGYKRIAANMKSKKRPSKLPEEWEVIPDTHEGIVTQEEFDTVQQLMTSRRREQNAGGFENIFSGVIKCADCGYAMRAASANRRKRPDIIDCVQYTCNNYGRYGNVMCTAHSIEARDLFNAVLADINRFADMAVNDEKAVRAIERRLTETDQSRAKSLEKEKKKLNKRLAELDRLFSSLYEDKVMERITERNFEMMSGKYQKEQLEIEARLKEVTETLNDSYEKSQGVRDFLSLIRNYQGLKELDATIINALIDKILVSEREKLADGTVRQEIKIYYKFIGFVGELHITPTKRWTALKPKNCTVCGVEYVPSSGISKYCPACAKRIQREKSNESKRRSRERNRRACIELSAKNDRLNVAAQVDGVDLWLCGHEHIELSESVTTPDGSKTYVSESGHYLNSVGLIDLTCTMDEDGSVHVDYEKTSVDYEAAQNYPKDASVTDVLDTIKAENETALNRVIGTSPVELDGVWEHIRIGQTNLGNVITDAYLLATGADIAFENAGGIRASIAAGTVTYGDVINVSPYGNYVVTKKLTGAQIKEMLESSLTIQKNCIVANDSGEWDAWPNDSGSYLQVGGITVRFDPAQPAGERVLSVQKDGQELDDTKEYTVAVNNYLAGSDSYPQLADAAEVGEYSCCEELLIQFFEQGSDAVTASAAKQNMIQTTKETVEPEQPSVPVTPSVPEQPSKEQPEAAKTEVKKEQASGTKTSVKSPKTADSNELFCWMILLLLSGGAGSICLVQGNKR
jgi:site-specific DNA recombinase